MPRKSKPDPFGHGNVRCRAVRGPRADGRWYWRAEVYEGRQGRTVWTGWATPHEAHLEVDAVTRAGGHKRETVRAVLTVADLLSVWIGTAVQGRADLSPHTVLSYTGSRDRMVGVIGDVLLARVGIETLETYRDRYMASREGRGSGTVVQDFGILQAAWNWGRERGLVEDRALPRPRVHFRTTYSHATPTHAEVQAVIEHLSGWRRVAVHLLYATGARPGEIAALRWRDVNNERGSLMLSGKTGTREVPVLPEVLRMLDEWRASSPDAAPDDLVLGVPKAIGRGITKHLRAASEGAGVREMNAGGIRRLVEDTLQRQGVDVGTFAAWMGHSPEVALRHYRRATAEDKLEALRRTRLGARRGRVLEMGARTDRPHNDESGTS